MDYIKWLQGVGRALNNLLFRFIMVTFDLNVSEFMHQPFKYALDPYTSLFGNLTWGILFGFVGAGVYVGSHSQTTTFAYLVIVGIVFSLILPAAIISIFGIVMAFIGAIALYTLYVTRKG